MDKLEMVQLCSQVPTLLAEVQRLKAETAEAARQLDCTSAERDAAVADARRLRRKYHAAAVRKQRLAVALDDTIQGVYYERRAAGANAESSKREVRAPKPPRLNGRWCLFACARPHHSTRAIASHDPMSLCMSKQS